jgi:AcrR family transcriptional regulator
MIVATVGRGRPASAAATRERFLRAGLALARKGGLRAITVRALAQRARANPGSFVYHFGTREAYLAELLEQWYAPLMTQLQLHVVQDAADPLDVLRGLVLQLVRWAQANAPFVAQLVMDAAAGEAAARRFFAALEGRHPALLLAAIVAAQNAGRVRAAPPVAVLLFLMSTVALPVLLFQGFNAARVVPLPLLEQLRSVVLDPAQAEQRLDWALRGLAPDGDA